MTHQIPTLILALRHCQDRLAEVERQRDEARRELDDLREHIRSKPQTANPILP